MAIRRRARRRYRAITPRRTTTRTAEALARRDTQRPLRRIDVARLLDVDESWVARHLRPSLERARLQRYQWPDVLAQLTRPEGGEVKLPRLRAPRAEAESSDELKAIMRELDQ